MSNSSDLNQAQCYMNVGPNLDPNCLQRLTAELCVPKTYDRPGFHLIDTYKENNYFMFIFSMFYNYSV